MKRRPILWIINLLFSLLVLTVTLVTLEWIHRISREENFFTTYFEKYYSSYILAWLLLLFAYLFILGVTGRHAAATGFVGIIGNLFGIICYYKLVMRSEPFLPWDLSQIGDLGGIASNVKFTIPPTIIYSALIFLALFVVSFFVRLPYKPQHKLVIRLVMSAASLIGACVILFGIYLVPSNCEWFHIYADSWMQDRYYRKYGVITGFMTNLTLLDIIEPENYSAEAVEKIVEDTEKAKKRQKPLYDTSYAANADNEEVVTPNIIYVMNESFWDVSRLDGITYDRELTPNLTKLKEEGAYGLSYSPSFGGGTCDVEFEALTGFSVEYLPSGSKPYQQYVTKNTFSLPRWLLSQGYSTTAIHGYYERFWSRNKAYPNLGINDFISLEDIVNPDLKRGFVSDHEMTQQIISEYEKQKNDGPVFIHAVTMQNHTTYGEGRYSEDDFVNIVDNTVGLSSETLTQLRDFATGVYEADAALGELVDYLRTVEEPTILVFWGDHFNPLGKGYELFENTGWIAEGDTTSPNLRGTDLLIWSNFDSSKVELGTIGAYEITPVMMDLYGIEKPLYFDFLTQEMSVMRSRSHGVTVNVDGTYSDDMTDEQKTWFDNQWIWQYDMMFGGDTLGANTIGSETLE
ncbi:MAG: LTA synthase family protein [Clostridia bacterium]|nr:LTA synthase family protein [Clostridia bacterium]NLS85234.1 LTA synthase family protein [Oscillospiraceae bacterium]